MSVEKWESISEEVAALPTFEPEVISKELGAVKPEFPLAMPYLAVFFMDIAPKKVHDVKVKWWPPELRGILDVEISSQLPSIMGGILNNSDLADREVLRGVSESFSSLPLSSVTIPFPWRVSGLDIVRAIWAWLTGGRVRAKCWGSLSEFIFSKEFRAEAWVPVR